MSTRWLVAYPSIGTSSPPDLSPASSPDSRPNPTKMPAEIVVLLDSEDNPTLPRRVRPRGLRPLELLGQQSSRKGAAWSCPGQREATGQGVEEPQGGSPDLGWVFPQHPLPQSLEPRSPGGRDGRSPPRRSQFGKNEAKPQAKRWT